MNRRGFLQGVFGGVASTGLIVAATPNQIQAFSGHLHDGDPVVVDIPVKEPAIEMGQHLYTKQGELIAIVTGVDVHVPRIDMTMASDSNRVYLPGHRQITLTSIVVGSGVLSVPFKVT